MATAKNTSPARCFRVAAWKCEYVDASVEAATKQDAERIALSSLEDSVGILPTNSDNIEWSCFDSDIGIGDVEEK